MCGGTAGRVEVLRNPGGLSPRVRGNRHWPEKTGAMARSIPACAGEPETNVLKVRGYVVYPRVCGGTVPGIDDCATPAGLSPRVRGNRHEGASPTAWQRSIPACAGEPPPTAIHQRPTPVYPRVCGGTSTACSPSFSSRGLSPRVRGNPGLPTQNTRGCRSIPACAGEPPRRLHRRRKCPVYPRVCGGTGPVDPIQVQPHGLSPRVRGNRAMVEILLRGRRSIPACAGEPGVDKPSGVCYQVYPRVCGGTVRQNFPVHDTCGLSPRVRGNRKGRRVSAHLSRSIPACAGEPTPSPAPATRRPVYPRVCGGTTGCPG